jgi:hypothetical protein
MSQDYENRRLSKSSFDAWSLSELEEYQQFLHQAEQTDGNLYTLQIVDEVIIDLKRNE